MSNIFVSDDTRLEVPEGFHRYEEVGSIPTGTYIDVLLFHRTQEDITRVIEVLLELTPYVRNFYYVVNEDNKVPELETFFISLGAVVKDNEAFITQPIFLKSLLKDVANTSNALAVPKDTVNILEDFQDKVVKGEKISPQYLKVLGTATTDLLKSHDDAQKVLENFSNSHLTSLRGFSEKITGLVEHQSELKRVIDKAKAEVTRVQSNSFMSGAGNVTVFPAVPYTNTNKAVFIIKELGTVPFTTSFMLGFKRYLTGHLNKRVRLLIIIPQGNLLEIKYKGIEGAHFISRANFTQDARIKSSDILVTNYPVSRVLKLIADIDDELLLVLDKTTNDINPIYRRNSKDKVNVRTWYAVATQRDKDTFIKNKPKGTYISNNPEVKGAFTTLGAHKTFKSLDTASKYNLYSKVYGATVYNSIYNAIYKGKK